MTPLTAESLIHFYDTRARETLCGLRGFEQRSTKHARGVTCPACVGLLRMRLTPGPTVTAEHEPAGTAGE